MASTQATSTAKTKPNRLPAPALFVGPPSRNASALSVALQPSRPPSPRRNPGPGTFTATPPPPSTPTQQQQSILDLTRHSPPIPRKTSRASLDAQWSDLQRTLNEVENAGSRTGRGAIGGLSAGATVFGARHAEALRSLRDAQIRLAEAWGPVKDSSSGEDEGRIGEQDTQDKEGRGEKSLEGRQKDGERDLRTAAERRERNEEYFSQVRAGVRDVVSRLDEVSKAMRKVEEEGREIWDGSELEEGRGEGLSRVESKASGG